VPCQPRTRPRYALARDHVEPSSRAILVGGDLRIFPPAFKHSHRLESSERSIERAVGCKRSPFGFPGEIAGDLITVKFRDVRAMKLQGREENGLFDREERTRLPAHGKLISRYLPNV